MKYLYNEDVSEKDLTEITKQQKEFEQLIKEIDSLYPKIENLCKKVDNTLEFYNLSQILVQIKNARSSSVDRIKLCEHNKVLIRQVLKAKGK